MFSPAIWLSLATVLGTNVGAEPQPKLTVSAECVHATEGGPVIILVKLRNDADTPLHLFTPSLGQGIGIESPAPWKLRKLDPNGLFIIGSGITTLGKGEEFAERVYVHHRYSQIPAGSASLKLTWKVAAVDDKDFPNWNLSKVRTVASLSTKLDLDVEKATRERLVKFLKWLEGERPTDNELALMLLWCEHAHFTATVFEVLLRQPPQWNSNALRPFVYHWSRKDQNVHDRLIKHLQQHGTRLDNIFFDRWREDKVVLSLQEVVSLMQSDSLPIRIWTYRNWPDKCEATVPMGGGQLIKKQLRDELERLRKDLESAGEKKDQ